MQRWMGLGLGREREQGTSLPGLPPLALGRLGMVGTVAESGFPGT